METEKSFPGLQRAQLLFTPEAVEEKLYEVIQAPRSFFDLVRPVDLWGVRKGYRVKGTLHQNKWLVWSPKGGLVHLWVESDQQTLRIVGQSTIGEHAVLAARPVPFSEPLARQFVNRLGFTRNVIVASFLMLGVAFFAKAAHSASAGYLLMSGAVLILYAMWGSLKWQGTPEQVREVIHRIGFGVGYSEVQKEDKTSVLERHRLEVMERIKREKEKE